MVSAKRGLARGIGTGSADLAAAADGDDTGGGGLLTHSRSGAFLVVFAADLPLNRAARKPPGLLPDCAVAIAALLDVGAGELIALQRVAVGGDVHGAAVRKHPRQLVVGHARPVPDRAGVQMDEGRAGGRIEADAAALQTKAGGADIFQRHARNVEVHRMAQHVLGKPRHAGRAAAEHGVGGGGAVGGDDIDRLLAVDVAVDFPEDVEQATIHRGLFLAAPVAEKVIELLQRVFVVAAVALEGDGQVFVGMGVVEGERAGLVPRGRIMDRAGPGQQQ